MEEAPQTANNFFICSWQFGSKGLTVSRGCIDEPTIYLTLATGLELSKCDLSSSSFTHLSSLSDTVQPLKTVCFVYLLAEAYLHISFMCLPMGQEVAESRQTAEFSGVSQCC